MATSTISVSLGAGIPFNVDRSAINDFETLPNGNVTDLSVGVTIVGNNMSWGPSIVFTRN